MGKYSRALPARSLNLLLWGSVSTAIVAAPLLAARSEPGFASVIYIVFSPVCHQRPGRCFTMGGYSWAVCQRCSGIYIGLFLASLLPILRRFFAQFPIGRRVWVLAATAPLALDALLPATGIWTNTAATRFGTGLLFGVMLSTLLVAGFDEIIGRRLKFRLFQASAHVGGDVWTRTEC